MVAAPDQAAAVAEAAAAAVAAAADLAAEVQQEAVAATTLPDQETATGAAEPTTAGLMGEATTRLARMMATVAGAPITQVRTVAAIIRRAHPVIRAAVACTPKAPRQAPEPAAPWIAMLVRRRTGMRQG